MSTRPTTIPAKRRGKLLSQGSIFAVVLPMACPTLRPRLASAMARAHRPRGDRRNLASVAFTSLVALGSCTPPASTAASAPSQLPPSDHPLNGEVAPNFALPRWSPTTEAPPTTLSLAGLAGKVVLLDFWATWCKPCKASFPTYQQLQDTHGGDIAVVAISEDDETDEIPAFLQDTSSRFSIAWDEDKSVARNYQIQGMPTLFLIGPEGVIRNVHEGFRPGDEAQLRNSVEAILAER